MEEEIRVCVVMGLVDDVFERFGIRRVWWWYAV